MSPRRRLIQYVARYRRAFVTGFVCVVLATAITTGGPWVLKYAIDDLSQGLTFDKVRWYGVLLFVLAAAGGIFRFLMRRIIVGASRDFEYDLRNDFFAALQRQHLAYFQHHRTGDLMSRATSDLGAVRMMMGPAVMYTASTVLTFIVAIILMISIDRWLTLVALVPLPLVTVVVKYFGDVIHKRFEKIQEQLSDISAIAQESLAGVRVVRAYGQEAFEIEKFRQANHEYVTRNRALIRVQGFYFPSMGLLMGIGALLVLWLGSRRVVAGQMTIGELVAFNAYLTMLGWPMIAFGWVSSLLQRGMASWKRLLEVLDAEPLVSDAEANEAIQSIDGEIEFRNLTFAFGDAVVLRGISLRIPRGTTTAIVGGTGSGKSTLLNLLPRLHEPPAGTVFIDGIDVRTIPLRVLRGAIGSSTRSRSCSAPRLPRTSPLARAATRDSAIASPRRPPSRGSTKTWRSFLRDTRQPSGSAASRCRAGRSNGWPSLARSLSSRRFSSWTMRCLPSTRTRKKRFSNGCRV